MTKTTIQVRVDENLKMEADELFEELGLTTNDAIKIFLKKAIRTGGIPFEISLEPKLNPLTIAALKEVDEMIEGKVKSEPYSDPKEFFKHLGI